MPREKVVFCETYRKGAAQVLPEYLPTVRHTSAQTQPVEMYVLKQGVIERGSETFDFQDVRLFYQR